MNPEVRMNILLTGGQFRRSLDDLRAVSQMPGGVDLDVLALGKMCMDQLALLAQVYITQAWVSALPVPLLQAGPPRCAMGDCTRSALRAVWLVGNTRAEGTDANPLPVVGERFPREGLALVPLCLAHGYSIGLFMEHLGGVPVARADSVEQIADAVANAGFSEEWLCELLDVSTNVIQQAARAASPATPTLVQNLLRQQMAAEKTNGG